MAAIKIFTAQTAENAKPRGKPYKLATRRGFYLHVSAAGGKAWRYDYRLDGKRQTETYGKYPALSLAAATARHEEFKKTLDRGVDPHAEKQRIREVKEKAERERTQTFRAVSAEWLAIWSMGKAQSTINSKKRFTGYLNNALGDIPVKDIKGADILKVARLLEADGYGESAHRVVMAASQVFDYALMLGYADFNPAARLSKGLKTVESVHYPAIVDPALAGELLKKIDAYFGCVAVKYCLKIMPYLPLRSTELRGALWKEIDLEKRVWTIPAYRGARPQGGGGMKSRRAHTAPLSRQVTSLFQSLKVYSGQYELCFSGERAANRPITGNSLNMAIRRMGFDGVMRVHGFRAMFSTMMNERKLEMGLDGDIIEAQLAHKEKNAVRGAYNHAAYLEQRRRMLQEWADYLDELRSGACS